MGGQLAFTEPMQSQTAPWSGAKTMLKDYLGQSPSPLETAWNAPPRGLQPAGDSDLVGIKPGGNQ